MTLVLAEFMGGPWDGEQRDVPAGVGEIEVTVNDRRGWYLRDFNAPAGRAIYHWQGWLP